MPRIVVIIALAYSLAACGDAETSFSQGDFSQGDGGGLPVVCTGEKTVTCELHDNVFPTGTTDLDKGSYRTVVAEQCVEADQTTRFELMEDCGLASVCFNEPTPTCVPCGERAFQRRFSSIDGETVDNCEGCQCNMLAQCSLEKLVVQDVGYAGVLIFEFDDSNTLTYLAHIRGGKTVLLDDLDSVDIAINSLDRRAGGLIDFEWEVKFTTYIFEKVSDLTLSGRTSMLCVAEPA